MFNYYTAQTLLVVFLMLNTTGLVITNNIVPSENKKGLVWSFILIIFAAVLEWSGNTFAASSSMRWLIIVSKAAEHSIAPVIPVLFAGSVGEDRDLVKRFILPLAIHAALEITSPYTGLIFSVDDAGVYHREYFYPIYVAAFTAALVFMIFSFSADTTKYQTSNRFMVVPIMLLTCAGAAVQFIFADVHVTWLCISICAVLLYTYYAEIVQQIDPLSGLLNRSVYENAIGKIKKRVIIVYFDADNFKKVNDNHGHAEGDEVLKVCGSAIRQIYGRCGKCFRIGGDEFCVILTKSSRSAESLNQRFFAEIEYRRQRNRHFPNVSLGISVFSPGANDTVEAAIKRADEMMYKNKEKRKAAEKA